MQLPQIPNKRLLLIIAFILLVFILGFLLYFVFFRSAPVITEPDGVITPPDQIGSLPGTEVGVDRPLVEDIAPGELPDAIARGGITQTSIVTANPILGITQTSNNRIAYYNRRNGQFYTLDNNENIRALSDRSFPNVESVAWSGNGEKAILEFPDGANIFYDFETDTQVTLPRHWTDFEYSPNSNEIIFKSIGLEPENNFLSIADETGSGAQIIEFLGTEADRVNPLWSPNNLMFANYAEPLDASRQTVTFIGKNDENFLQLTVNGYNFNSKWNPNGSQLLYEVSSAATNNNPSLWIVNAQPDTMGTGRRPLNIETSVDKCVFQDTVTVYCAVPQFLPDGSGIIPSIADGIPDDIYKLDVRTGSSSLLAELDIPIPVGSILLSPDERYLYFTDAFTGSLGKIKLR